MRIEVIIINGGTKIIIWDNYVPGDDLKKDLDLLKKIVPDMVDSINKRYNILRSLEHAGSMGRRGLVKRLQQPERSIRKDLDFLRSAAYVQMTGAGAVLTQEGRALLKPLDDFIREHRGIIELEEELASHFSLERVVVVPGHEDDQAVKKELGRFTACYLHHEVQDDEVLAVTGGTTLAAVARAMGEGYKKRKDLIVIPGRGGLGEKVEIEANTIAVDIARALGGTYKLLYTPDSLTPSTLETIKKEPAIGEVLSLLERADYMLHGIGEARQMALRRHLPAHEIATIEELGGIGEAFGYYFNREGEVVYTTPSVGIRLKGLKNISKVIAVAGGEEKAQAIMAVVRSNYQNILITDEAAARKLKELLKKEEV